MSCDPEIPPRLDTVSFSETLQFLRHYPRSPPETAVTPKLPFWSSSSSVPAFSTRRLLNLTGWAGVIFVWLFAILTLLSNQQAEIGFLMLVVGPILALLFRRLQRRTPATDSEKNLQQELDAVPESDAGFQPVADVFPLRPDTLPITPIPQSCAPPGSCECCCEPDTSLINSDPRSVCRRFLISAVSLAAYVAIAVAQLPDLSTSWIVATILLHETGHFAAMYLLGYSNLIMLFLPYVGGAVIGTKQNASPAEQLIILLAGPAPGLLIGCLIYWLDAQHPMPIARSFAFWLVGLNLLNLLPSWPLDGGRIGWVLFARRSPLAGTCLSACTFAGWFLLLMPHDGTMLSVLLLFLLLMWLPDRYRRARGALRFFRQYPDASSQFKELSEQQLWTLYGLADPKQSRTSKVRAAHMMQIHSEATLLPRTAAPLRYLLAFVLLWMIALATAWGTGLHIDARDPSAALTPLFDFLFPAWLLD